MNMSLFGFRVSFHACYSFTALMVSILFVFKIEGVDLKQVFAWICILVHL